MRFTGLVLFMVLGLVTITRCAEVPARLALLIGNQDYAPKVGPLKNTLQDIELVGAALEKLGFKVTKLANATKSQMDEAIRRYADRVRRAGPNAISFFYYSGHGVVNPDTNVNYLIPVDIASADTDDLWYKSFEQPAIINLLSQRARNATHFVVFDACRSELNIAGDAGKALGAEKGFAPVNDVNGILIAYATAQNRTAADNGVFARILAEELVKPDVEAFAVFREVQVRVQEAMKQEPWMSLNYIPRIYLASARKTQEPAKPPAVEAKPPMSEAAQAWADIKDWKDVAVFEAFRKQYGPSNQLYDTLAEQKIAELKHSQVAVAAPQKPVISNMACDGLLVSVALSNEKPCIKPGSGESLKDCPECPEMVVAPSGSFIMGSRSDEPESERWKTGIESPQHQVSIAKPFAVGKFAVTFAEWDACVRAGGCGGYEPSDRGWGREDRPVINVSWDDAQAYAKWLSGKTGKTYRLLSEAEFEYAARAGTSTPFWWGSSITPDQANYNGGGEPYRGGGKKGEYRQKTLPVKSFKPNPWGLYQVHGNVWTWVEDCYADNYNDVPTDGSSKTTGNCSRRSLRGGSWYNIPSDLRAAYRDGNHPGVRFNYFGFRLARTLNP